MLMTRVSNRNWIFCVGAVFKCPPRLLVVLSGILQLILRFPRVAGSPYKAFNENVMMSEGLTGPRKPILHHLRAYGCKAFTLMKFKGDPDYPGKLRKLAPRAHIGYLVGYESKKKSDVSRSEFFLINIQHDC
jgi:hypothetical protein